MHTEIYNPVLLKMCKLLSLKRDLTINLKKNKDHLSPTNHLFPDPPAGTATHATASNSTAASAATSDSAAARATPPSAGFEHGHRRAAIPPRPATSSHFEPQLLPSASNAPATSGGLSAPAPAPTSATAGKLCKAPS